MEKKTKKMDRRLISKQAWEIRRVREIFIQWIGSDPFHPSVEEIKGLIKDCNNSRKQVYGVLRSRGYENVLKK